jgi:hypothetical protein
LAAFESSNQEEHPDGKSTCERVDSQTPEADFEAGESSDRIAPIGESVRLVIAEAPEA